MKLIPESPMANQLFREVRGSWDSQDLPPLPELSIPFPEAGDITAFFGKRTRGTLRERQSKLEREKRLQFRSARTEQEAERAIDTYVQQHIDRWASRPSTWAGGRRITSIAWEAKRSAFWASRRKEASRPGSSAWWICLLSGKWI